MRSATASHFDDAFRGKTTKQVAESDCNKFPNGTPMHGAKSNHPQSAVASQYRITIS
jgi:hypothetical protein